MKLFTAILLSFAAGLLLAVLTGCKAPVRPVVNHNFGEPPYPWQTAPNLQRSAESQPEPVIPVTVYLLAVEMMTNKPPFQLCSFEYQSNGSGVWQPSGQWITNSNPLWTTNKFGTMRTNVFTFTTTNRCTLFRTIWRQQ
jgi:hypothetical protein